MRRTVPPSAEIEERIDALLAVAVGKDPRRALSDCLGVRPQGPKEGVLCAWGFRASGERS